MLADVAVGLVPATCASFSELHDYVDANGYGGAFEDGAPYSNWEGWDMVQNAVDAWIKAGGIETDILASYGAEREEYTQALRDRPTSAPDLLAKLETL